MAFIIGTYNKYDAFDRAHSKYKFQINDNWYAIKEVELEWGLPQLGAYVDRDEHPEHYHLYDTYEDAMRFVMLMKGLN